MVRSRPIAVSIVALAALVACGSPLAAREAVSASPVQETIDEVETRDGRIYRGRVVGYDVKARSYLLEFPDKETPLSIPENDILTVRNVPSRSPSTGDAPAPSERRVEPPPLPPAGIDTGQRKSFIGRLAAGLDGLLAPRGETARARFDEGVRRARARRLAEAVKAFRDALALEPDCLACELFVGAAHLAREEHAEAFTVLEQARRRRPDQPLLLEMLAEAAGELGYLALEARYGEEAVRLAHDGAERARRIFELRRHRDPAAAAEAWKEYLALDPDLSLVDSAEARLLARGESALEDGEPGRALRELAAAARVNPFAGELLRPLRVRALEALVDTARRDGAAPATVEGLLGALEAEAPGTTLVGEVAGVGPPGDRENDARSAERDAADREEAPREATDRDLVGPPPPAAAAPDGSDIAAVPAPDPDAGGAPAAAAPPASGIARYFPLAEGSWWDYRHGDGTRETLHLASVEDLPGAGSVARFDDRVEFEQARFDATKSAFVSDGSLRFGEGADPSLAEPVLAEPVALGTEWSWRTGPLGRIICEREYVDLDADVSCSAGAFFHCLVVRVTRRYAGPGPGDRQAAPSTSTPSVAVVQRHYYAPGVGLVKVEAENPLDSRELVSFAIGEAAAGTEPR